VGPAWPPAYAVYGQWLMNNQRVAEAASMAMKAAELDSSNLAAKSVLMDVYALRHDWVILLGIGRETLRIDPDNADGQRVVLVAQDGLDELDRAERRAKAEPTVDNYLSLSVVYYRNGKFKDCIEAARGALQINSGLAEAYANIANAHLAMGKPDDAIPEFREALRLNPALPGVKNILDALTAAPSEAAVKN
jgi:tetratricopeptide (TPR) repeat protein